MEQSVKVSVVTPSFNQGEFIERTIESIINQTYGNIQYILVDGGSTDMTMDVVERYRDKIDIIIHERDKGQSDAINKGFRLATGELVGWLNSDDILYPDAIEKVVQRYLHLEKSVSVIMPTSVDWIDSIGAFIKNRKIDGRSRYDLLNNDYKVVQQGSFYKTEFVKEIGFCDASINYCMDLDLILRLTELGEIVYIDGPTAGFRMHESTKTSTGNLKFLDDIEHCLKKHGMKTFSKNDIKLKKERLKKLIKNAIGVY